MLMLILMLANSAKRSVAVAFSAPAQQFGLSQSDAGSGLAKRLPARVNQFTPNGEVPNDVNDMISQLLTGLSQKT